MSGAEQDGLGRSMVVHGMSEPVSAQVPVPGDKSISHRAVMLGMIAGGTTRIRGFLPATDCLATIEAARALGIEVEYSPDRVLVHGKGLDGLREPARPIDCGGSGTTMRLLAGLLSGQSFYSVLAGNEQLSGRPMNRVAEPLRSMGATVLGRQGGKYAPLAIQGNGLKGISYSPPVASAQVKSALLLAGLYAEGTTEVEENLPTRDHTERMLAAMGAQIKAGDGVVQVRRPASQLNPLAVDVPGDISSAAFMLAAGAVVPGSRVTVPGVGVNPGRTGILDALERMGAHIVMDNRHNRNGEPVADITLEHAPLRGIRVGADEVPGMIDELPLLAVVATQANGPTEVRGAAELRVKETDRIATIAGELAKMGAQVDTLPDGFIVRPSALWGAQVSSHGDHRIAMSLAIAALAAAGETLIENTECVDDSFPGFERALQALGVAAA